MSFRSRVVVGVCAVLCVLLVLPVGVGRVAGAGAAVLGPRGSARVSPGRDPLGRLLFGALSSGTHISGVTYSSDTTWTLAGSPYVLDGNVTVAAGARLTVEPGVVVKFNGQFRTLNVNGTLWAVGTPASHIVFTSYQDDTAAGDTNGDGSATSGAAGQWYHIAFASSGSRLSYAEVRYGGAGSAVSGYGAVYVSGSGTSMTIDHSTLSSNLDSGVLLYGGSSASISSSTFSSDGNGISVNNASVTVVSSTVSGSGTDAVWFNLPGSSPLPPASSITGSDLTGSGRYGVYIGANGTYPLASMPHGNGNNIYGNNNGGTQLTTVGGYPYFKNAAVDWSGNYWGEGVYYWYNPSGCSGASPFASGHLAYRSGAGNPPAGPLGSGSYLVGQNTLCADDPFTIGPGDFSPTKLDTSPHESLGQTFGSLHGRNATVELADPVNSATGSFDHTETDLSLPGTGVPFTFTRYYHSADLGKSDLGQGWTDSMGASLTVKANGDVTLRGEDGQQESYTKQPDGSFVGAPGALSTLVAAGGGYELTRADQVKYHFDGQGRLTSMVDRNGQGLTLAYDGNGRLATVTDAAGRVVSFTHDGNGLLTRVALPDGTSVSYAYANGALTSVTDAAGKTWAYSYEGHGFLQSETDPLNHTVFTNVYGSDGRVSQQTDALGKTTTFAWDQATQTETATDPRNNTWKDVYANDVLTKRIDAAGNTTQFGHDTSLDTTSVAGPDSATTSMSYDARGNLLTATAPPSLGSVTKTFTYDALNNVTSVTDARGKVTSYGYDANGNNTSVVQDGATVAQNTYNSAGQLTSSTDGNNKTTTYTYDTAGNLASVTDPLGNKTTHTYDAEGRMLTRVDPLGNISGGNPAQHATSYSYDAAGRLLSETDQLGHATTYAYDAAGNQTSVTDANGHTTTYAYDAANHLTSITGPDPDGAGPLTAPVTSYAYDPAGNRTSVTDPDNHTTSYAYDSDNRLTSVTTPKGETTSYGYDGSGNLALSVDPRGNVAGANPADYTTSYTYDAAGRLLTTTDPLGHVTSNHYDAVGNLASVTDANNHTTGYSYDAAGRILTVTAPDNGVTSYSYDPAGNTLSRTDANNHVTTYTYDGDNQPLTKTLPLAREWSYSYDANGNLATMVDANGNATQIAGDGTTSYNYDAANRLTGIDYSDSTPDVGFAYDAAGNRTSMSDGAGTQTATYDALNRLTAISRGGSGFSYGYDPAGNMTSRTYPDGTQVAYSYDEDNRLASVASSGATTGYGYDAAGNLTQTTLPASNGYVETRTYDHAGRLVDVKNANASSVLSEFAVTLDPVGNPTRIDRSGSISETATYGYDANDRLTSVCYQASCPGGGDPYIRWAYDPVGNRLTETRPSGTTTYSYNAADELTTAGSTSYGYDANGNETSAGARTFSYDLANRLASTSSGGTTTTYSYDGDGNRLTASSGGTTTKYLWDTSYGLPQLALETDGAGSLLRRYIYGARRISMTTPAGSFYYHYDQLGSVTNVTSSSGASEWTYSYEPFGNVRAATQNDPTAPDNPMQFTGEYTDPSGSYNLRAREYQPDTGTFLSPDPAGGSDASAQQSEYRYANDQPTVMVDPSGATFYPASGGAMYMARIASSSSTDAAPSCDPETCAQIIGTYGGDPAGQEIAQLKRGGFSVESRADTERARSGGRGRSGGAGRRGGPSDNARVGDILSHIRGDMAQQIDARIRNDPDLTLGQIRTGMRTGKMPDGTPVPKSAFSKAKKILTDHRFRKSP